MVWEGLGLGLGLGVKLSQNAIRVPWSGLQISRMNESGAAKSGGGYFDHEKLVVYQKSLEFQRLADALGDEMPANRRYLADQLHRAAVSITLNIAEGAGEFSPKEKVRFYRIAKRSVTECSGTLDSMIPYCTDKRLWESARSLLVEINSMMIGLIISTESRGR